MPISKKIEKEVKQTISNKKKNQKEIQDKSLILVYTGDGKGKTSAALGMMMRCVAHGFSVAMIQFMKDPKEFKYAENKLADKFANLDVFTMGAGFTWDTQNRDIDIQTTLKTWEKSKEIIYSKKYDLIVLDEINYVIDYQFLDEQEVLNVLNHKPPKLHLALTGRNASRNIIDKADLVTEMKNIKHPFETKGILAQKGIDW